MKKLLTMIVLSICVDVYMYAQGLPGNIVGKTLPYTWELPFM